MSTTPKDDIQRRLEELGIVPGNTHGVESALNSMRHVESKNEDSKLVFLTRLSNNSDQY